VCYNNISQYYSFYSIFDQINAALVQQKRLLSKTFKKILLALQLLNIVCSVMEE